MDIKLLKEYKIGSNDIEDILNELQCEYIKYQSSGY